MTKSQQIIPLNESQEEQSETKKMEKILQEQMRRDVLRHSGTTLRSESQSLQREVHSFSN